MLAIFAVFSGVMVAAVPARMAKGVYFIAARILTAAVAAVFAHDVSASATAVSLTFAGVLVLQHIIRGLMRNRLQQIPFQQAAVWVTLSAQAVLPATYLSSVSQPEAHDGGRWVLLLELAVLLVSAVVAHRIFTARGAVYFTIPASIAVVVAAGPEVSFPPGTWLAEPLLGHTAVPLVLLAMSLVVTCVRLLVQPGSGVPERWFWLAASLAFGGAGGWRPLMYRTPPWEWLDWCWRWSASWPPTSRECRASTRLPPPRASLVLRSWLLRSWMTLGPCGCLGLNGRISCRGSWAAQDRPLCFTLSVGPGSRRGIAPSAQVVARCNSRRGICPGRSCRPTAR